jgi:Domain of unknown function (DUF4406)
MKFPPKIVYIAGSISTNKSGQPSTKEDRADNVEAGRLAGIEVWKLGAVAIVPHLNSLTMWEDGHVPGSDVYLGDLEILGRCDAMLVLPGWQKSRGVNYEVAWAKHKDIPIFGTLPELENWLNGKSL